MKIGILGSGGVAQTLGAGLLKHGHTVMLGTREPQKLADWGAKNAGIKLGTNAETAAFAEVIVLAAKGTAAKASLQLAGEKNLAGKVVLDATNPIADGAPVNGVLPYFTSMNSSLMEQLQLDFPAAKFVKAFNSVGAGQMVNPSFKEGKPTMFICGNDAAAKKTASTICDQLGWEAMDMGAVEAARAIEPLCILWCIPGIGKGDWSPRAFKMLR
jgi:predicted dinucleotide-binding enzyme